MLIPLKLSDSSGLLAARRPVRRRRYAPVRSHGVEAPGLPTWAATGASCPVALTRLPWHPRVHGLPSPVCTPRSGRQSRRQETVTGSGECPAQRWYARWFAITNVHRLPAAFPTLTRVVCCPSAAFRWVAREVDDAPSESAEERASQSSGRRSGQRHGAGRPAVGAGAALAEAVVRGSAGPATRR
jgi:hypothetical protein